MNDHESQLGWARQLAIQQREADPDKYLQQKFAGYNPLRSVFRTEPSETEYARLLAALPNENRMAVSNAMRLFNGCLEQIGGRADFGRRERTVVQKLGRPVVDLQTVRRMAAGS